MDPFNFSGGLIGKNLAGTITNCFAAGNVSGLFDTGGLVGKHFGAIDKCYATGDVGGALYYSGGLVGYNYNNGAITDCFWNTQSAGQLASDGGTGKTTAEMQMETTFTKAGWDFVLTWWIGSGNYPKLSAINAAPQPCNCTLTFDTNNDQRIDVTDLANITTVAQLLEVASLWLLDCDATPGNPACIPN